MTTRNWIGGTAFYRTDAGWSPTGVPVAGDTAMVNSGSVTIGSSDLASNLQLELVTATPSPVSVAFDTVTSPLTLTLQNTVVPTTDEVDIVTAAVGDVMIRSSGNVTNYGTVNLRDKTTTSLAGIPHNVISIGAFGATNGSFTNDGTVAISAGRALITSVDGESSGQLINNGVITTIDPYAGQNTPFIAVDVPVTGTGRIEIGAAATWALNSSVGAGQTISFNAAGGHATLVIGNASAFAATIAGFDTFDDIDVTGPYYDSRQVSSQNGVTTLSFVHGSQTVTTLKLVGNYTDRQIYFFTSSAFGGEEQTSISVLARSLPFAPVSVYRFFDTTLGTHFFTADANEAASISSTRPDMVAEGVGLAAVNPASNDPNAAPIYRFFDQTFGTHFFTASASERDTLIATRPDLVFEPNSVFYEHTTPQSGDEAVYRFFDTAHGTHFYTGNASEGAAIAASRPDLVSEGIGFYAPST